MKDHRIICYMATRIIEIYSWNEGAEAADRTARGIAPAQCQTLSEAAKRALVIEAGGMRTVMLTEG